MIGLIHSQLINMILIASCRNVYQGRIAIKRQPTATSRVYIRIKWRSEQVYLIKVINEVHFAAKRKKISNLAARRKETYVRGCIYIISSNNHKFLVYIVISRKEMSLSIALSPNARCYPYYDDPVIRRSRLLCYYY